MSESVDFINLTLSKDDITEAIKDDDEVYFIIIDSEKNDISLKNDSKTE